MLTHLNRSTALVILLATVAGFAVYGSSLSHGFVDWDDGYLIRKNHDIRTINPTTVRSVFSRYDPELYIPLTFVSYQLDHLIAGLNPTMFHLTNLLLHIANALLTGWFIALLSRKRWIGIIVTFLFLLHPLHTEAVAWASARKDVLSTAFYLSALITYLYYIRQTKTRYLALTLTLALLGLLSKVMVVTLPLVLIFIDWHERRPLKRSVLFEKIPFFLLAIAFGLIAVEGKANVLHNSSTFEKGLMAAKSSVFYIQKLLLPEGLSILHPYEGTVTITNPDFFIPILILILALILILHHKGNRALIFGACFYVITLMPTFTNFSKGGDLYVASDRYAYLPSIGLMYLLVVVVTSCWEKWQVASGKLQKRIGYLLLVTCYLLLAVLSYHQSKTWSSTESLMLHTLKHYPDSYMAYDRLGGLYKQRGELERSLEAYETSLQLKPHSARVHSNIGALYAELNRPDDELRSFERSLELNPNFIPALYNLGHVYTERGRINEAIAKYEHLLSLNRYFIDSRVKLANLYVRTGKFEAAKALYSEALQYNAHDEGAINGLANIAAIYVRQGKLKPEEWGLNGGR